MSERRADPDAAVPDRSIRSEGGALRVDVCLTEFPVISETFVLGQITGLIDRGHEVRIVVLRRGETDLVHADVTAYALLERIEFQGDAYALMPRGKLARLRRAVGLLAGADRSRRRVLLRALDVRRHGKDALTLNLFFRAHRAMAREAADVALCHFAQVGEAFARLDEIGATATPVATVYHGQDLARHLPIRADDPPYPALFRSGALHLPVSDHWRRVLLAAGVAEPRVAVHHMGIDIGAWPRREPNGGTGEPVDAPLRVLTICRFVEKKGLRYAIDAFARFARDRTDAEYRIVGDGPLADELAARAARQGPARIRIEGPVDAAGVRRALAGADVFLLPSVTADDGDREGIPVVLMEAMAAGVTVVSSVHSGIPELVEHEVTGLLAAERDVEALADSLRRLQDDPALRARLATAARESVADGFDVDRLNDVLVDRLRTLVAERRG